MTESQRMWIKAAAEAGSYRRMYFLAAEIAVGETASRESRAAARRVVRVLEDVVDRPIADALVLARARKRFAELVAALECVSQGERPAANQERRPVAKTGRR